jgi:hypothetical protein
MKGPNRPDAISSANSSYYDPSAQFTPADGDGGSTNAASVTASNAAGVDARGSDGGDCGTPFAIPHSTHP